MKIEEEWEIGYKNNRARYDYRIYFDSMKNFAKALVVFSAKLNKVSKIDNNYDWGHECYEEFYLRLNWFSKPNCLTKEQKKTVKFNEWMKKKDEELRIYNHKKYIEKEAKKLKLL